MFEELDDPSPDLRPAQLLPQVRARGRALRRRRQAVVAGSAGTALALVAAVVLALPGGQDSTDSLFATSPSSAPATSTPAPPPEPTPEPTTEPTAEPSSAPTPVPVVPSPAEPEVPDTTAPPPSGPPSSPPSSSPAPPASGGRIELRGDDLLVTRVGAPRAQAVAAVAAVLGPPSEDPSSTTRCVASMQEVAWPELTLAFDEAGTLSGWTSRSASLRTPSGVTVGTTVARLREVYGEGLRLYPPNPDNGDTYVVDGVAMVGALSGSGDTDRVVALSNGTCTGP